MLLHSPLSCRHYLVPRDTLLRQYLVVNSDTPSTLFIDRALFRKVDKVTLKHLLQERVFARLFSVCHCYLEHAFKGAKSRRPEFDEAIDPRCISMVRRVTFRHSYRNDSIG